MATNVAPSKNTGGEGFNFENDVCAWLLASMLVGEPVFGADCGAPVRLDFQTGTGPNRWFLDDVLVTTAVGPHQHRFALSVKSNKQFTATSAPSDFVTAAWEQWLHIGSPVFEAQQDFMGIVTAPLSYAAKTSLDGLVDKARVNDPILFAARLATPNWANRKELALFNSFACPVSLGQATTDEDTARLLTRLRFVQRDFEAIASESQNIAIVLCRRAVRTRTSADAQALWSILRDLASELRPRAGSLTLSELIDRLRARVVLADYPDHAADWATLDARSAREAGLIRDSIADRIHFPRVAEVSGVLDALAENAHVSLLGTSGVGKSALAKMAFEHRRSKGERTLWIDASSIDGATNFGGFELSLQLLQPLAELLAKEASRDPVIIIDGIDRLCADRSFRTVATLLRAVNCGPQATRWRVLAVCQSQEWQRVLESLHRAGAELAVWREHEPLLRQQDAIQPIRDSVPKLARLMLEPRVGALLSNLKLLDLVVRRLDGGADIDASALVGESSVAEWFWIAEIDRGPDRLARVRFARSLAQVQADQLAATVSVDSIDPSSLAAAQSLTVDQLLVQLPGDRLAFAHDLYGDWARFRILQDNRANLAAFLKDRHESPLWHRAIRLLGNHLLERDGGVEEWKALISSFGQGEMTNVRDLLLEAPAFAVNAGPLLERVFPDLVAGDGVLLRRLLNRFLAFASVPNPRMQLIARAVGMDANAARAAYRQPHWPYWLDVLRVLHVYRDDAVRVAPSEIAKIVEMWLEFASAVGIRRREAAALAVMLGQRALDSRHEWFDSDPHEDRQRFYKCALLAAPERPDDVVDLARAAAERVPRLVTETVQPLTTSSLGPVVIRGPWADGPLARVDDDFQHVILEMPGIEHLYRVRPAAAREVILACLLHAPQQVPWASIGLTERELGLAHRRWTPALFTRGPFLLCLQLDFIEGLELIMRLVECATERSNEEFTRSLSDWQASAAEEGRSEAAIEEALRGMPRRCLVLHDGSKELSFSGDAGSYGWSAGVMCPGGFSPFPPSAVTCALMALEKYFYLRLDAGHDIADEVSATFARCRTVAPLGVLVDVGKRQRTLFEGPLQSLLSAAELYGWEIAKMVQGRASLMIGAFMNGPKFITLAQDFHGLAHREINLRHVAMDLLLKRDEMRTFFSSVREWWNGRRAAGEQLFDMASQLDLLLDATNYEVREDSTHGYVVVNTALERMENARAEEHQELNDQMLVLCLPTRCRTILDERHVQTDLQLEDLWQTWEHIRKLSTTVPALAAGEEPFGDEHLNAIMGGVAVFLWHEEWMSRHEGRRAEVEGVLQFILSDDSSNRSEFRSELDASTWTWNCFLAEAAAMLWTLSPKDVRWRRLVAEGAFARKYTAVRLLFVRCNERRGALGDDFGRLRRLVLDWAHVRDRVNALQSMQNMIPPIDDQELNRLLADVKAWADQTISSFVDGTIAPLAVDWRHFDEAGRFAEIDFLRQGWPDSRLMDFHLVRCSHDWMPLPDGAQSPEERIEAIDFWRVALEVVTAKPRADLKRRDQQYPNDDESWVLENAAAVVLQLGSAENPEAFWALIIELHSEAHDWPELFLNALHRRALAAEVTPTTYAALVREIAKRAFTDIEGDRRWPWHEKAWDALLGIDYTLSHLWADRHADHVVAIWDVISLWMEKTPQEGQRLSGFASWLSKSAAALIRLRSLPWLLNELRAGDLRSDYRESEVGDAVAGLLNVIWDKEQSQLRASSESSDAFRGLLSWLVERQNSRGLELQGRIGGLA